jgi:hypothetical protein
MLNRRTGKSLGGVRIETREMIRGDALLFSESQSRIVGFAQEENLERLKAIAERHHVRCKRSAPWGGTRFTNSAAAANGRVEELKAIWSNGLTARLK